MQLLVSVANGADARAALAGGADVVDAKNPRAGSLGAVSLDTLADIYLTVGGLRPVTAAIGDASDEVALEQLSFEFAAAGTSLVKVGFSGISTARVAALIAAARRGVEAGSRGRSGVVAVGYADDSASVAPAALVAIAARAGARGVLLDTANKRGPGLPALIDLGTLAAWVADAHRHGLFVALAGKLTADDLPFVVDSGADIAGVRGAACEGGRAGHVSADRVRMLSARCGGPQPRSAAFNASTQSVGTMQALTPAGRTRAK
jgi:hypothetical protein